MARVKFLKLHVGRLVDPIIVRITPEMENWRVARLMEWMAKKYEDAGGIGIAIRNEIMFIISRARHEHDDWQGYLNLLVKDLTFEEGNVDALDVDI